MKKKRVEAQTVKANNLRRCQTIPSTISGALTTSSSIGGSLIGPSPYDLKFTFVP